jgi:raffinose/stachyose/melibiose transport system permease protein
MKSRPIVVLVHRALLALLCLIALIPFVVVLKLAFFTDAGGFTLTHFAGVAEEFNILRAFFNSAVITVGAIVILLVCSSLAGYSIARNHIVTNKIIYYTFLFCMMIPAVINSVPLYKVMQAIGGINSQPAMMFLLAANSMPFATFLIAGYMSNIPIELEEAASVDGASALQRFARIVLPMLKPVFMSIIIIQGIGIWNNYAQVVFYLQDPEVQTIPLAMQLFFQQYGAQWHLMSAATVIAMLPALLTFVFGQKYFMSGLSSGALKG